VENASFLFQMVPAVYFASLVPPFGNGLVALIPLVGLSTLMWGGVIGYRLRDRRLWWFALPIAAIQLLVGLFGWTNGDEWVVWSFLTVTLLLPAFLVYRLRGVRAAAALLWVFVLSYALVAAIVAAVSGSGGI